MGHQLSTAFSGLGRFFEYPVKRKPICFYRQEDFTATGNKILLTSRNSLYHPNFTRRANYFELF